MAHYFLDSSGLVKRYVAETGSGWVQSLCAHDHGNIINISRITTAEVIAAIFRRLRMGDLRPGDAQAVAQRFKDDFGQTYRVIEVTADVVERAMNLAEARSLRGYDAVQLATALELHCLRQEMNLSPLMFVSADGDLNEAAEAEGLLTDNPTAHP
jgi:predicted nucleic acid-binding protein